MDALSTVVLAQADEQLNGFLRSELPLGFFISCCFCPHLGRRTSPIYLSSTRCGRILPWQLYGPRHSPHHTSGSGLLLQISISLCANRNHIAKISSHTVFFNNFKYHIVSFRGVCQRCYPIDCVVNSRSPPGRICQAWKKLRKPL